MKLTLDELVDAVNALPPEQQAVFARRVRLPRNGDGKHFTREQALTELDTLRAAGAFADAPSLLGKYTGQGVDVSAEELDAALDEAATAWKSD